MSSVAGRKYGLAAKRLKIRNRRAMAAANIQNSGMLWTAGREAKRDFTVGTENSLVLCGCSSRPKSGRPCINEFFHNCSAFHLLNVSECHGVIRRRRNNKKNRTHIFIMLQKLHKNRGGF